MSKKILLIDNNPSIQQMVEKTMGEVGYIVACADNSLSALDMALKARPDLILADSQLKGMRFEAFCQKIKHKERLNDIPLLLLMQTADMVDERRLKSAGVADFITKPIDPAELIRKIRNQIEEDSETVVLNLQNYSSLENSIPPPTDAENVNMKKMEDMLGWSRPADVTFEKAIEASSPPASSPVSSPSSHESFEEETKVFSSIMELPKDPPPSAPLPSSPEPVTGSLQDAPPLEESASPLMDAPAFVEPVPHKNGDATVSSLALEQTPPSIATMAPESPPAFSTTEIAALAEAQTRELVERVVRETVEQILWEVIPPLAEAEIKKAVEKIQQEG